MTARTALTQLKDLIYSELLDKAATEPTASVHGAALTVRFTFDSEHGWLDYDDLVCFLSDDDDRDLFADSLVGGRLPRLELARQAAHGWLHVPGAVRDRLAWVNLLVRLEEQIVALDAPTGPGVGRSIDAVATLFEDLVGALCGWDHEVGNLVVEVQDRTPDGRPHMDRAAWCFAMVENLLAQASGVVSSFAFTYPGHGQVIGVTVTSVVEGSSERIEGSGPRTVTERFDVTVPADPMLTDLVIRHFGCVEDPDFGVPVVASLNEWPGERAFAMWELPPETLVSVRDEAGVKTGAMVAARRADIWTLYYAADGFHIG